ncbi:MAG: FlgD immunoglobulin-like domain containing protein [Bacteroidota bacterium]
MKKLIFWLLVIAFHPCFAQTAPSVQYTLVPGWGTNTMLQGRVSNTTLADHGVAVYIFLEEAGGWWNKPYAGTPVTPIRPDSGFSVNIAIAATDPYATKIIAFLVPLSYVPPVLSGGDLPAQLLSYPYVVSCRPHGNRVISWSGLEWVVKKSIGSSPIPMGPGPNIFNDNDTMVWVDSRQKLHLRIARHGSAWHCSELICKSSLGYKRYSFEAGSRVDLLDPNVIAGMFTWDDCAPFARPPDPAYREIDLEFSRWGDPGNKNSQFVIQPYDIPGNMNRFDMNLAGTGHSDHFFDWSPDSVGFQSRWGDSSCSWTYNKTINIPVPGSENVRINFYLYKGFSPADRSNAEFVLNSFTTGTAGDAPLPRNVRIFPNPTETGCEIDLFETQGTNSEIGVFDLRGKLARRIFSGKLAAGRNRLEWDGRREDGANASPGLYLLYIRDLIGTRYYKIIKI